MLIVQWFLLLDVNISKGQLPAPEQIAKLLEGVE